MMDIQNFRYQDMDGRLLSLHDCRANRVLFSDGVLSFIFPDGIVLAPNHPHNPTGEPVRTGLARVDFPLLTREKEDVSVCVFRRISQSRLICREWPLEELADALLTKKCELEFISRYDGYLELLYECCLWQERKPYHRDCQLKILAKQPVYRWNEICEDCNR